MNPFYHGININLKSIFLIVCLLNFKFVFSTDIKMDLETFKHISDSCNHFSTNIFQALTSAQDQENVVSSAFSAHIILSLLFHGADGATKEELRTGLHLSDPDQLQKELKYLYASLNSNEKVELEMANAIYIDKNFTVIQEFLSKCNDVFQTFIDKMNYKNNIDSADQINVWITHKTRGKISHIINSDDIDEDTKVLIINTFYFKSAWLNPFESELTEKKIFHNINNVDMYVPTMFKTLTLPHGYIESLDASFIKIKYLNQHFEMIIVLPTEKYGIYELEKKFKWDLISQASYSSKEVELSLPKFKIEATVDLKSTLEKLGISSMFKEKANFSFISEEPLYVNKVLQKLFIQVDEKGSEAAVATVAEMRARRMIVDVETFTVDHPFIFVIHHIPSSIPLFTGSIRKVGDIRKDEL